MHVYQNLTKFKSWHEHKTKSKFVEDSLKMDSQRYFEDFFARIFQLELTNQAIVKTGNLIYALQNTKTYKYETMSQSELTIPFFDT